MSPCSQADVSMFHLWSHHWYPKGPLSQLHPWMRAIQRKGWKREAVLCCWKRLSTAPVLPAGSALKQFFSMHKELEESNWEAPGLLSPPGPTGGQWTDFLFSLFLFPHEQWIPRTAQPSLFPLKLAMTKGWGWFSASFWKDVPTRRRAQVVGMEQENLLQQCSGSLQE